MKNKIDNVKELSDCFKSLNDFVIIAHDPINLSQDVQYVIDEIYAGLMLPSRYIK